MFFWGVDIAGMNYPYCFKVLFFSLLTTFSSTFIFMDIASGTKFSLSPALNVVDIIFYHDFSSNQVDLTENNNDCFKPVHHAEVVRCAEYAHLLRSVAVTEKWQRQQRRQGYFLLTDAEASIREVHAHIIRVHDSAAKAVHATHQTGRVTGRIIRYSPDVKTYTFYDLNTHIRSKINATPEHRFYVVNKQSFIPLSKITSEDQLINESGRSVKLLYAVNNGGDSNKYLLPVYNLEVADHHVYFAGTDHILVHNGCFNDFPPDYLADKSTEEAAWFVNSQVNLYVKYSLTRLLVKPEYFKDRLQEMFINYNVQKSEDFMTELYFTTKENRQIISLIQSQDTREYIKSQAMRERLISLFAIRNECGNCAEMCVVGKKILQKNGFKQSFNTVKYEDHTFLVLGDKDSDAWISDPWGKVCFPKSEIEEKLKIYNGKNCWGADGSYQGSYGELLPYNMYVQQYPESAKKFPGIGGY